MADITNAQAIEFAQQYLRPMAETLRALQAKGNAMQAVWNAGASSLFPNDTSPVIDYNAPQHPFTGAQANTIMTRLGALLNVLNAAYAMDGVVPACVRTLDETLGS